MPSDLNTLRNSATRSPPYSTRSPPPSDLHAATGRADARDPPPSYHVSYAMGRPSTATVVHTGSSGWSRHLWQGHARNIRREGAGREREMGMKGGGEVL
jgi:hypothetical protein